MRWVWSEGSFGRRGARDRGRDRWVLGQDSSVGAAAHTWAQHPGVRKEKDPVREAERQDSRTRLRIWRAAGVGLAPSVPLSHG